MRHKTIYILIFMVLSGSNILAQNLVPDWSFEYKPNWVCNISDSLKWFNPHEGTLNGLEGAVYNQCRGQNCANCTPYNGDGYQVPRHGQNYDAFSNGYLDVYSGDTGFRNYDEIKLSGPLHKDSLYYCEYFLSLSNEIYYCATSDFGMYLSNTRVVDSQFHYYRALALKPQVINPALRMLSDTQNWMPVSGIYKARGSEQFIILGDFADNGHSHYTFPTNDSDSIRLHHYLSETLYYLDDVSVIPVKNFLHQADTVCHGPYWLHPRYRGVGCLWPDSSHGDSFMVTKAGVYPVVYDSTDFAAIDSITVIYKKLIPDMNDTALCRGMGYTIRLPDSNSYSWQDGNTGDSMFVNKAGTYWVTASKGSCQYTDTIHVKYDSIVDLQLPADTVICSQFPWAVRLNTVNYPIQWQDGDTSKNYIIDQSGMYSITVLNACHASPEMVNVHDTSCPCNLYVPDAFTPDQEINRIFIPLTVCDISSYELFVYNRWGLCVYQTMDIHSGWDGSYKGTPCPGGVYAYYLRYRLTGQNAQTQIGNIELMR